MDESDFEGTLVLEKLARIDAVDKFTAAVNSDDSQKAAVDLRVLTVRVGQVLLRDNMVQMMANK